MANRYRIIADGMTISTILLGLVSTVVLLVTDGDYGIWLVRVFSVASILDFADGKVARRAGLIKRSIDPDTVADYMVFGVLGGLTVYYMTRDNVFGIPVTLLFTGVAFYRLRRFATQPPSKPGNFDGIPAPFGAYVAVVLIPLELNEWIILAVIVLLSALMATKIPYPAFKRKPTPGDLAWILGMGLIIVFLTVFPDSWMIYPAWALIGFMAWYIVVGPFSQHEYTPRKTN